MDPLYEQMLRDEVIYLHSLWHRGPPRPAAPAHLQPLKTTQFKELKNGRGKSRQESTSNTAPASNSSPGAEWPCLASPPPPSTTGWPSQPNSELKWAHSAEWPCPASPPPPSTTGWPSLELKSDSQPRLLSTEEKSKLSAIQAHRKAVKAVHEFLMNNDSDDAMDSSSDEDDELVKEDYGREEYSLFFKVLRDDTELREYYEKNFAKGEFGCLVCGAIGGKRTTKKFKGCLALVQHSITIANTKKRRAHRAFGQAVCKLLGWDIHNLSAIVSMLSDQSGDASGAGSNDALEGKNEEAVPENVCIRSGISPNGDEGDVNSTKCCDGGKNLEDDSMVRTHNVQEPASNGLTCNPLECPDLDKNLQNRGMMDHHNMEEPAAQGMIVNSLTCPDADENHNVEQSAPEGLMINSLTSTDADRNLENLVVVHPHSVEDTASEWL